MRSTKIISRTLLFKRVGLKTDLKENYRLKESKYDDEEEDEDDRDATGQRDEEGGRSFMSSKR